MRTTLQKKELFLGTTQQSMEHGSFDTSVYFDSKQGIDSALAQPGLSKRSQQMPLNQVIVPSMVSSEDELTRIIITNPSEVEVGVKPIEVSLKPVSQETLESGRKPQDEPSESVELQSHTQDQFQPQKQESTNDSESQEIEESNEKTNKSSESKNGKENSTDENQTNSSTNTDSQLYKYLYFLFLLIIFKQLKGVIHELLNERWRDTIFFPTYLAASIKIIIFT